MRSLRSLDVNFRLRRGGDPEVRYGGAGGDSGLWAVGEGGRLWVRVWNAAARTRVSAGRPGWENGERQPAPFIMNSAQRA